MLSALGIVLFALGILASIALHEVGHLVPAKRSGVKVTQYMVGFGPTLWSRRRGETEYGLKWIPLGGYIRMIGMFPPGRADHPGSLRRSSTGPFFQMVEDARTASREEIAPGDEHRAFYRLPVRRKLLIMLGGPVMNLLIAAVLFTVVLSAVGTPRFTNVIEPAACVLPATAQRACAPGDPVAPSARAGLQSGDRIVAVSGRPVEDYEALTREIRPAADREVLLTVERGGQRLDVPVQLTRTARPSEEDPQRLVEVGFLGISPAGTELAREPIAAVPARMWDFTVRTAEALVSIPQRMVGVWNAAFGGAERDVNGPIGVVGVTRIGGEVAAIEQPLAYKVSAFLGLLASLNMALFVFNLLPLLPLDGGHVAGALWEGLRRQVAAWRHRPDPGPVDVARMLPVAYTVALLLVSMSALLLYADIVNPIRLRQ
ncbi:MAG: site-2 protease family protein [Actinomycetota bacterium]|nr:site-2 protease family protein [Actinomycetota bacterium]